MMIQASGTLAAIAQVFGGKSNKAMASFRSGLGGGSSASAGDSPGMGTLRDRIHLHLIKGVVAEGAS